MAAPEFSVMKVERVVLPGVLEAHPWVNLALLSKPRKPKIGSSLK